MTKLEEFLTELGNRKGFSIEYCPDYQESRLDAETCAEIAEVEDIEMALADKLFYWECDIAFEVTMYYDIIEAVKEEFEDEFSDHEITDAAREVGFYTLIDHTQFLKQNRVKMVLKFNDIEVMRPDEWEWRGRLSDKLVRTDEDTQQFFKAVGTSMTAYIKWYNAWDGAAPLKTDAAYLWYTIYLEFLNLCYSNSDVVILMNPTLSELVKIRDAKEITVDPTSFGFASFWNGSGSLLEIKTGPLTLKQDQFRLVPDRSHHYSVQSIYSLCESAWECEVKYE